MTSHGRPTSFGTKDTALYQAKRTKGRYEVFGPSMHTRTLKLDEDLRRAIESGGFEVHYQPQ